jgi:hypothetical protein
LDYGIPGHCVNRDGLCRFEILLSLVDR